MSSHPVPVQFREEKKREIAHLENIKSTNALAHIQISATVQFM